VTSNHLQIKTAQLQYA